MTFIINLPSAGVLQSRDENGRGSDYQEDKRLGSICVSVAYLSAQRIRITNLIDERLLVSLNNYQYGEQVAKRIEIAEADPISRHPQQHLPARSKRRSGQRARVRSTSTTHNSPHSLPPSCLKGFNIDFLTALC